MLALIVIVGGITYGVVDAINPDEWRAIWPVPVVASVLVFGLWVSVTHRMRAADPPQWAEIPKLFEAVETPPIEALLERGGVRYRREAVRGEFVFRVARDDAARAAALLAAFYRIGDEPPAELPFTGLCEACGEQVVAARRCPECALNFAWRHDRANPIVAFIDEYGERAENRESS